MKKEAKRVKNNDFEQTEECHECGKLFWAKSVYELGNWEDICAKCKIYLRKLEIKRLERIKTKGKAIKGEGGILGWKFGKEELINANYNFPERYKDLTLSNIDDKIREIKRNNIDKKITIRWGIIPFEILRHLIWIERFGVMLKNKFRYMGVTHIKDIKVDRLIVVCKALQK